MCSERIHHQSDSRDISRYEGPKNNQSRALIISSSIANSLVTQAKEHPIRTTLIGLGSLLFGIKIGFWYGVSALVTGNAFFTHRSNRKCILHAPRISYP